MKTKITLLHLMAIFVIVYSATAMSPKDNNPGLIEITKHSTKFYLDSLTIALGKKGILLELDTVRFNDQGKLQKVSGQIRFSNYCNGTFSTDNLDKIVISKKKSGLSIEVN